MQIFFICEKLEQRVDPLKVLLLCFRKLQQPCFNSVFRDEHKAPLGTVNDKHHRGMPSGIGGFLYSFLAA